MSKKILIGGAWPYANYYLHVGHVAALVPGDILAKYYRANGDEVLYVSGSDCHGTPITERAKKENKSPEEIAKFYDEEFRKTFTNLGFQYDEYSNTMTDYHKNYVQEQFLRLIDNGYIFEQEVEQEYCEDCEKFLSDREIVGICPHCNGKSTGDQCEVCNASLNSSEVKDKHCKDCGNTTFLRKNKHLYFKLPEFEPTLQELINKNRNVWRKNAVGEAQKYIDMGLIDRAATRQINWGVPVPVKGYEDKRIYVWIEAVLGYLSVGKKVAESRGINFDEFMNDDSNDLRTYYVHGKDNIPFHTTIFPALVSGLKRNYRLPDYIVSSAYVNINDEKMSKSTGNLISANELLETFDSDTIRFYLTFNGPEKNDTNCTMDDIIQVHNKFLVGIIGNFVNRNLSFVNKKFDGVITETSVDPKIVELTEKMYGMVGSLIEKAQLKDALAQILEYASLANKYYDENQPWIQVKENIDDFNKTTYTCAYMMSNMSNLLYPYIPNACTKIKHMIGLPQEFSWTPINIKGDIKINDLDIIYNRIDEKKNDIGLESTENKLRKR
jgi:methionyl-tRNA synthetase